MIKKCSLLLGLLFLMLLPAAAEEDLGAWSHFAELEFSGTNKYKALFVPEAVYGEAATGLTDIRIVDNQENFVPYYMQSGTAILRQNRLLYQADLIQAFTKHADRYLDFRIRPLKENADISGNLLVLDLPADNFLKHIRVYGGYDGDNWDYIGTDYVFRAAGQQKQELSLGGTKKYTFYRLVMLDNPENISFKKLQLANNYTDAKWNSFFKTAAADFTVKNENKSSVITIANEQKLNIRRITLEVEENFQRSYQLYSENVLQKKGELYNLQLENTKVTGTSIDLEGHPISSAALVLKIDNRDDRPLTINGVQIEYYIDKLVFPDLGGTPYYLYFGNKNTARPQYELELQKAYIEREAQDNSQLGAIQQKTPAVQPAGSWNMKYVFNGIIIVVSILLIILILPRLQRKP